MSARGKEGCREAWGRRISVALKGRREGSVGAAAGAGGWVALDLACTLSVLVMTLEDVTIPTFIGEPIKGNSISLWYFLHMQVNL